MAIKVFVIGRKQESTTCEARAAQKIHANTPLIYTSVCQSQSLIFAYKVFDVCDTATSLFCCCFEFEKEYLYDIMSYLT